MSGLVRIYTGVFHAIERFLEPWFLGFLARFVFAGVLFFYFFNSALTKVGDGVAGFFQIQAGAFFQILPAAMERFNFDPSQVPFFPHGLMVYAGTYGEFVLPVLVVIGLFTRVAALGMIAFVAVQTYVDIAFHGVDTQTIGMLFDRISNSAITDQRTLWLFPLIYLAVKGPGLLSLDWLLGRSLTKEKAEPEPALSSSTAAVE